MKRECILFLLFLFLSLSAEAFGQQAVFKTNLLYWTTGTPNLSIEVATGQKHSVSLAGGFQPWQYSDGKKLKHWLLQPEFRYWPCETFNGHFGVFMRWAGSSMLAVSSCLSVSFRHWRANAFKAGLWGQVFPTVTIGCSTASGV